MTESVRLRADPEKVRIGLCYQGENKVWVITVRSRNNSNVIICRDKHPKEALEKALKMAEKAGIPGIDLAMQWAYDHPQKVNTTSVE